MSESVSLEQEHSRESRTHAFTRVREKLAGLQTHLPDTRIARTLLLLALASSAEACAQFRVEGKQPTWGVNQLVSFQIDPHASGAEFRFIVTEVVPSHGSTQKRQ